MVKQRVQLFHARVKMYVPYHCHFRDFEEFYVNQAGDGLPYYQGQSFQRGYGIGGWFKKLFRTALPFLRSGAKTVGKEVLRTGTQIANDLLEGKNIQESAELRAKETGKKLARKAIKKADDMLGHGKAYKRKRKSLRTSISFPTKKSRRRDIFDQ